VSVKRTYTYTPDTCLTDTYSTLADSRPCCLYGRSFGHAWLHRCVIDTLSHCRQYGTVYI